ncbi:glucose-induced degradation protein 8 homolog [Spodoptera litura]|uniref:Glucose-induced degradation protein 8 homolog n=1 Tax=Spodoptera litura TaxID=69820 RepID=A0A9J7DQW0_SPOLT|nr:glucose-induced degradation protein 8 homolog [Spodoptera litura]
MSFDLANSGQEREDRKYYDRNKGDDMQISRTDMNMLIMNYLVTEGFKEAAIKFQQEAGLQEPALCSSLDERIMIREAVQTGRIPDAIAMVNALHPELLDNDRYLYFHLQVNV